MAKKQKEEKVLDKIVEESKDEKTVFKSDFSEGVKDVDGNNRRTGISYDTIYD